MAFILEYSELKKLIEAFGFKGLEAEIMAEYLDEYCDYDMDLSYWLWNIAGRCTEVVKGDRNKAEELVKENVSNTADVNIFEFNNGCFVEWY